MCIITDTDPSLILPSYIQFVCALARPTHTLLGLMNISPVAYTRNIMCARCLGPFIEHTEKKPISMNAHRCRAYIFSSSARARFGHRVPPLFFNSHSNFSASTMNQFELYRTPRQSCWGRFQFVFVFSSTFFSSSHFAMCGGPRKCFDRNGIGRNTEPESIVLR